MKKASDEQQKVGFSYSRIWPPVVGAAILMTMFLAWVAAKPLVVDRLKLRTTKRPGRPPLKSHIKRNMSTPNVDTIQKV